ncbi:hypothetical protein INS49_014326 [Diaporthe citri]|uniref:uncharacterized protein n=1 Tax=Diaporthe citri TaxID=83186 RepID=UPI001C7EED2F|nr:uncharacterized protein INS49_014326 [Diaporthe citri]KAG6358442.1 hypothetical protein INS49_014326 [Diaporthe citri]
MATAATQKKTVLITGCSTGSIGWALTKVFLEHDFHVFAGVRDRSKAKDLAELSNVDLVELDVTVSETILKCKQLVAERTDRKLDVLINCAGVEGVRPLLDMDMEWAKQVYEVNVWGPLAVTQAFAPLVIKSKGIIANLSSIGGKIPMCWAGIYSSSKAAIAQMSDTLRIEMGPLGVRVVTVMVGSASTTIFDKPGGQLHLPETSYYRYPGIEEMANKQRAEHKNSCMSVDQLAPKLVKGILTGTKDPLWAGTFATAKDLGRSYYESSDVFFRMSHLFGHFFWLADFVYNLPLWVAPKIFPSLTELAKKQQQWMDMVYAIKESPGMSKAKGTIFEGYSQPGFA